MKEAVRVINKGTNTFKQSWNEEEIVLKPGEFKVMKRRDAVRFLGTFPGFNQEKNLEIEKVEGSEPEKQKESFISMIDGKEFPTQAELDKHLEQFKDQVVKNEEDSLIKRKK